MNRNRRFVGALVGAGAIALLVLGLRSTGFWRSSAAEVLPVPPGDQEIAWIETADSKENWQDLVTGALDAKEKLHNDGWPGYDVDTSNSAKEETTAVPE